MTMLVFSITVQADARSGEITGPGEGPGTCRGVFNEIAAGPPDPTVLRFGY